MSAKRIRDTGGSTFITAIIIVSILFLLSAGFLIMVSSEYGLNRRSYRSAIAINLAEAGVDYAVWALPEDADDVDADIFNWAGTDPRTKTVYSFQTTWGEIMGDIYIVVTDPQGTNPLVESTGYVPSIAASGNISRTVKALLEPHEDKPFKQMFFGDDEIKVNGTCYTDSYDSNIGGYGGENVNSNGDILTNGTITGAITLDGGVTINGDAGTGPGGTITGVENVTGEVNYDIDIDLPEVTVPSELTTLSYWGGDGLMTLTGIATQTLAAGDYKLRRIKLTASAVLTINGPARIYLTGYSGMSLFQTGSGEIICNGNVEFYVDDEVQADGNGITNSSQIPANFTLWGTASCTDISLGGANAFYGAVYTPSAEIDLHGTNDSYGSFVGNSVTCGGGSGYHYDEALAEIVMPGKGHSVVYWQEKE